MAIPSSYTPIVLEQMFTPLYRDFATTACWEPSPGCGTALKQIDEWRKDLGPAVILSNFDPRLHALLRAFGISEHFDAVFISGEIGWEKPEAGALEYVRNKVISTFLSAKGGVSSIPKPSSPAQRPSSSPASLLPPHMCVHVGDHEQIDVRGALAAGWWAVGVGDKAKVPGMPHTAHIDSVQDLDKALKTLSIL